MYGVSPQAYDRAITVFSPDGRLFQVEYAKEAVKRGATSIGVTGKEHVVIAAIRTIPSKLTDLSSIKKIYEIDKNIALSFSGLIADARRLVDITREYVYKSRYLFDEKSYVKSVANYVANVMQIYTQYGGARPFGVSLLIGGVDKKGPSLYEIEPSGALTGYYAVSIGEGKKEVDEYLENHYKTNMKEKDSIKVTINALKSFYGEELTKEKLIVAIIKNDNTTFLSEKEISKYL